MAVVRSWRRSGGRSYFARMHEIARQTGDRMGEAVATANLGMSLHSLGRFEEALTSYKRCEEIAQEIGAREGQANAAGNLGMIHYSLGHYARAAESCRRAVAISHGIGDALAEADGLSNLGTLEVALGRGTAARETLERALGLAQSAAAARPEGYVLHGLALEAEERGDIEGAAALHARAMKRWNRMGAKEALAESNLALGRMAMMQARWDEAVTTLDTALELAEATQMPGTILLATVLRARLPDGDAGAARDALARYEGSVGAAARMEAHFTLFELGAGAAHLSEAQRVLESLIGNAPAECRDSMREHVRLHREILAASALPGDAPASA